MKIKYSALYFVDSNIRHLMQRRNRLGTKSTDLWNWPVSDIRKMTGPLYVQEYIQEMIRNDPSNIERIIDCPPSVDQAVWKYEQVRQLVLQLNLLVTTLKSVCNCTAMKGSVESEFLCAAHKVPASCAAMDYMLHNLDQSTSLLLNLKHFPTRSAPTEARSLETILRRLYRIFSHSYHFHTQVFEEFQKDMLLCMRFTAFGLKYGLLDESCINVPVNK